MRLVSALPQIRSGDVLLFRRSRSLFGRLIRLWTQSPFSHVGIAIPIQADGVTRLSILEALEGVGVRLYPLDRYLEECHRTGCEVDWYALTDSSMSREKIAAFVLAEWGRQYARPWQFLWSWGRLSRWLRRLFRCPADVDPGRWFCSELVAAALRHAGYRPEERDGREPADTEPGWIALYPCLQRRGSITP